MSLVLDSSITLAWVYSEETTEPVRQVFEMLSRDGAWVPGLWRLEVTNILEMGVRRRRHDADYRDHMLADTWHCCQFTWIPKPTGKPGAQPYASPSTIN